MIVWRNCAVYGKLNRYNEAIEAYRQTLCINPEYADVCYNIGIIYAFSGKRTAARDAVP